MRDGKRKRGGGDVGEGDAGEGEIGGEEERRGAAPRKKRGHTV
jgi:hypothetical protein